MNCNDPIKVKVVCEYLSKQFTGSLVVSRCDFDTRGEEFTVEMASGTESYCARASREFLNDLTVEEIAAALSDWDLASELRRSGNGTTLLINRAGLELKK